MDVSQMSGPMQAIYLLLIYTAIGGCLYWFYNLLVTKKEDEAARLEALKEAKRAKRAKK